MDKKRKPAFQKLFVYGTLKDAEIQQYLFGVIPPPEPGVLENFAVHVNEQGYYFLLPAPGNRIEGQILWLDEHQLARADRWEEAPLYWREKLRILQADKSIECWVYNGNFKSCGTGTPGKIARTNRKKIIAEIKKTLPEEWSGSKS